MKRIQEMDYASDYNMATMWERVNKVIRVVNNLKCIENEVSIYETLNHNDVLIISKSNDGLLVAINRLGVVKLERVPYPKEEEKLGGEKYGF